MNKWIKPGGLLLLLSFSILTLAQAQKYGHLNSGNLLVLMPEAATADKQLETYRDQLVSQLKNKQSQLQNEAKKLQEDFEAGLLSQVKAGEKQAELQKKGQALLQEEYAVGDKITKKRDELLKPIVEKVDKAIQEIGKEGAYTMIFDTSIFNALLFVQDADDIMPLVKAKLGLK